jgi:hypothetical protein
MVTEIKKEDYITTEQALRREHSAYSHSRKVIDGPLYFPQSSAGTRNVDPVNGTVTGNSETLMMELGKAYRLISSVHAHFVLSRRPASATTSDIYLPANTPIVISAGTLWDRISLIKAAGASNGICQIVEVR